MGFAFTIAILIDATVIRIIVVPAIIVIMENWNWVGPKWLRKIQPHTQGETTIDIEMEVNLSTETVEKSLELMQQNPTNEKSNENAKG